MHILRTDVPLLDVLRAVGERRGIERFLPPLFLRNTAGERYQKHHGDRDRLHLMSPVFLGGLVAAFGGLRKMLDARFMISGWNSFQKLPATTPPIEVPTRTMAALVLLSGSGVQAMPENPEENAPATRPA